MKLDAFLAVVRSRVSVRALVCVHVKRRSRPLDYVSDDTAQSSTHSLANFHLISVATLDRSLTRFISVISFQSVTNECRFPMWNGLLSFSHVPPLLFPTHPPFSYDLLSFPHASFSPLPMHPALLFSTHPPLLFRRVLLSSSSRVFLSFFQVSTFLPTFPPGVPTLLCSHRLRIGDCDPSRQRSVMKTLGNFPKACVFISISLGFT